MVRFICETLAAGIGTAAFSLVFHVPPRYFLRCGVTGGLSWMVYLAASHLMGALPAIFVATVTVVFFSRFSAVQLRCPVTIFLIPGIFPLVPGLAVYRTAIALVAGDMAHVRSAGATALQTAVVMVLAIRLGLELPSGLFRRIAGLLGRR